MITYYRKLIRLSINFQGNRKKDDQELAESFADRFALMTTRIISPNQYEFVQGRQIQDCIGMLLKL